MFGKIKDGMKNHAQNLSNEQERKNKLIKELFQNQIENADDYIIGVAQTEEDKKGGKAVASQILTNTILIDWKDHIIGLNLQTKEIVMLEIDAENIVENRKFQGSFKIKKETFLGDEVKNTLKKAMKVPYRRSEDRYGRERFIINDGTTKTKLLIGSYLAEATNLPYDNTMLAEGLKQLCKLK